MTRNIKILAALQLAVLIIAAFAPFTHPHIIRQTDTMGASLMYWLRFSNDSITYQTFLPALLSAGDGTGISKMEFPILNLVASPLFYFGVEWGRVLANLFVLLLAYALIWKAQKLWRGKRILDIEFSTYLWLIPIVGITQRYTGKFMPDLIAFLLVLISVGYAWEPTNSRGKAFLFGTLGLLMKPPVVITYAVFFLVRPKRWPWQAVWIVPAIGLTVLYYKLGLSFIMEHADTGLNYFYTEFRNPFKSVLEVVSEPKQVWNLIFTDIFTPFMLPFILWATLIKAGSNLRRNLIIWGIFLLGLITGAALDGEHSFIHDYYYIGTTIVLVLIYKLSFDYFEGRKAWRVFFTFLIAAFIIDKGQYKIKPAFANNMWKQCSELNETSDFRDTLKVRTKYSVIPHLGLCLGKIQNSKVSGYGVYRLKEYKSLTMESHTEVKRTKDLVLVKFD